MFRAKAPLFPRGRFPFSGGVGTLFPWCRYPFPRDGLDLSRHGYQLIPGAELFIFQGRPPLPREGDAITDGRAPVVRATSTLFRMTGALISDGRAPCSEDVRRLFPEDRCPYSDGRVTGSEGQAALFLMGGQPVIR